MGWSCSSDERSEMYLEFQLGKLLENRHLEERGGERITLSDSRWVKLTECHAQWWPSMRESLN